MGSEIESQDTGLLTSAVITALKTVYDPEIPVNIYDMGLVYNIEAEPGGAVRILMTLTAPNCPVAETLPEEVSEKVRTIPGVKEVEVNITFDPPWTQEMLSPVARLELGLD